jgi:hypothetical protein
LEKREQESQAAKLESVVSIGAGILGAIFGSKKSATTAVIGKVAGAARGVDRIRKQSQQSEFATENLETLQQQKAELEAAIKQETDAVTNSADPSTEPLETISIRPKKTNISVRLAALAWMPVEGASSN